MENNNQKKDNSELAIGGGLLIGLGVGFFLIKYSPMYFIGSIIIGLGLGLLISAIISKGNSSE